MRKCVVLLMVFAVIGFAVPSYAGFQSMTLFDDFNKKKGAINALNWVGQESESDSNHRVIREAVRQIEGQQLHLGVTAKSTCTECGDAGSKYGQNRLKVRTSGTATALKATMKVNRVSLTGSTVNTFPAIARVRIMGYFFNDGNGTAPNDATGDVYAYICLNKQTGSQIPENKVEIQGYVYRCTNADCSNSEAVGTPTTPTPVSLGTVPIGQPVTLYVEWDQTNHKFIFQKIKGQALKITKEISYTLTDSAPPVYTSSYRLDVMGIVPNDSTAATDLKTIPTAAMDASIDDVYYTPLPKP